MQQMPQVHNGCQARCHCEAAWHKSLHLHVEPPFDPPTFATPLSLFLFLPLSLLTFSFSLAANLWAIPVVLLPARQVQLCTLLFALHALHCILPFPFTSLPLAQLKNSIRWGEMSEEEREGRWEATVSFGN